MRHGRCARLSGGGYSHLSDIKEGSDVAKWLNSLGISAFVLKYRLGMRYHQPNQLLDAARAIRTVRSNAKQWNIDPERIGILGFSAGGHLASTLGTHFDAGKPDTADAIDRESSRPDLMILIYPVITMGDLTHKGSRTNLLGNDPSPELDQALFERTARDKRNAADVYRSRGKRSRCSGRKQPDVCRCPAKSRCAFRDSSIRTVAARLRAGTGRSSTRHLARSDASDWPRLHGFAKANAIVQGPRNSD